MKIKTVRADYETVVALPKPVHRRPKRPNLFFRTLMRVASAPDLRATHFTYTVDPAVPTDGTPCLYLMNHSSFIDLEIASAILYPQPYGIVCTSDGFVGKAGLMRNLGCIPTQKFVNDLDLIRDMKYMLKEQKSGVLMYPEASYSFDGCTTPLPEGLGGLLRLLDVPVVMIRTNGAFLRDPLYNCLQKRKVRVSAEVRLLVSPEEIRQKSTAELDDILKSAFTYDHFARQYAEGVTVDEPFRADGLERILFKCPACRTEGQTVGKGTGLSCRACGRTWTMGVDGRLTADHGETEFPHIPDWYAWEREQVRSELVDGSYALDVPVRIGMLVDRKAIYMVGEGRLTHTTEGFALTGCDGRLHYTQKPLASYGLYADYYWYELGDIICIGNRNALYYCFPPDGTPVAKARMAAEELYKIVKKDKRSAAGK